jgi:hypothetical protein
MLPAVIIHATTGPQPSFAASILNGNARPNVIAGDRILPDAAFRLKKAYTKEQAG